MKYIGFGRGLSEVTEAVNSVGLQGVSNILSMTTDVVFLPLSVGQIGVRLIPILCLFSNQLFT
jgi:hypothetical protein